MLILGRRKDETIVINDEIRITVLEFRDGKVRLGIEAPQEVAIHREEVWHQIQAEKKGGAR